jgi:ubiquitin carboxyl-terminal hydrolase 5/13
MGSFPYSFRILNSPGSNNQAGNPEAAVEWLFSHPDDPGEWPEEASSSSAAPGAAAESSSAGAAGDGGRGPAESSKLPATYRLKAFVSHKGPSVHSGHYVAHVRKGDDPGWVLFNDEKVVRAEYGAQNAADLMPFAYLYVFERVEAETETTATASGVKE